MQQNQGNSETVLKIIILGEQGVGRTMLFQRFVNNKFDENFVHIISPAFLVRTLNVYEHTVKFQMWEYNSAERIRSLPPIYYRGAMGIIIPYDMTDRKSFNRLTDWHKEVQERAPEDAVIIIIGTKADLENKRKVTNEKARKLADDLGYMHIETSAKTGMNVDNVFMILAKEIIEKKKLKDQESKNIQKPNDGNRRLTCIG